MEDHGIVKLTAALDAAFARGEAMTILWDVRNCSLPSRKQIGIGLDWISANSHLLDQYLQGIAVILSSFIVRGILNFVLAITQPPQPNGCFADDEEAFAFARDKCTEVKIWVGVTKLKKKLEKLPPEQRAKLEAKADKDDVAGSDLAMLMESPREAAVAEGAAVESPAAAASPSPEPPTAATAGPASVEADGAAAPPPVPVDVSAAEAASPASEEAAIDVTPPVAVAAAAAPATAVPVAPVSLAPAPVPAVASSAAGPATEPPSALEGVPAAAAATEGSSPSRGSPKTPRPSRLPSGRSLLAMLPTSSRRQSKAKKGAASAGDGETSPGARGSG